jgi:hypothetical protein
MTKGSEYSIIPVSNEIFEKIPKEHPLPFLVNDFFYIEALLRTSKAITAFSTGGQPSLQKLFREHGILGHEALTNSHHRLLLPPPKSPGTQQESLDCDCLDKKLGLRDLAALANQPSGEENSPSDPAQRRNGMTLAMRRLKQNDPRYLFLEIDLSHPVNPLGNPGYRENHDVGVRGARREAQTVEGGLHQ